MKYPNFNEEKKLWRAGFKMVAGLDEAGRGPLAGPVVAGAVVILPEHQSTKNVLGARPSAKIFLKNFGIRDSKQLSPKKREELFEILIKHPQIEWGIGMVSEKVIDKINILQATKLAMVKALRQAQGKLNEKLKKSNVLKIHDREFSGQIDYLILDGNFKIKASIPQKAIVKADVKVFSCAAASIIAKVTRDRLMRKYDKKYPQYGFKKHKGYPTKEHKKAIKVNGFCPIHRKTFNWK